MEWEGQQEGAVVTMGRVVCCDDGLVSIWILQTWHLNIRCTCKVHHGYHITYGRKVIGAKTGSQRARTSSAVLRLRQRQLRFNARLEPHRFHRYYRLLR